MALVLSLKEGHDFYVGDTRYSIEGLQPTSCTLCQHRNDGDKIFHVTCNETVEVAPKIFIRAGLATRKGEASLDISAPKNILILRGDIINTRSSQQD